MELIVRTKFLQKNKLIKLGALLLKAVAIQKKFRLLKNKNKQIHSKMFFKTEKGQYAYGDQFLGISVPETRKFAKNYFLLSLIEIQKLLKSKFHEERLLALIILVQKYQANNLKKNKDNSKDTNNKNKEKVKIFNFYLANIKKINNWDLVDVSAPAIIGDFLNYNNKSREILYKMADSKSLWERRISIIATFAFIKNNDFIDTLKLSEKLIHDPEDLIHKACGWMLRELGKKDKPKLEFFLQRFAEVMPRTMLRYSIEKFDEKERKKWLLFYKTKNNLITNA